MDYRGEFKRTSAIGIKELVTETVNEHRNVSWESGSKSGVAKELEDRIEEHKAENQAFTANIYQKLLFYSNTMGENLGSSSTYLKNDILRMVDALEVLDADTKKELFGCDFQMDIKFRDRFWANYEKDVMDKRKSSWDVFKKAVVNSIM